MRLARAAFRLEIAELQRIWAIVPAHREGPTDIPQHAGYIADWMKPLKDGKREISRAAADAQKIADIAR
jgi:antirestriction protein ArdC